MGELNINFTSTNEWVGCLLSVVTVGTSHSHVIIIDIYSHLILTTLTHKHSKPVGYKIMDVIHKVENHKDTNSIIIKDSNTYMYDDGNTNHNSNING